MLDKSDGAMGIRNLIAAKFSLMFKNVLNYLNQKDVCWVQLLIHKYGMINLWNLHIPLNCSWLFRGICRIADDIKANLWTQSINPSMTSFLYDPWCFAIPIAYKPTYLNMHLEFEHLQVADFTHNNNWNTHLFLDVFGVNSCPPILSHGNIIHLEPSYWIWFSMTNTKSFNAIVYNHFNSKHYDLEKWCGWNTIWRLNS